MRVPLHKEIRKIILIVCVILPLPIKIFIYRNIIGWNIGENVKIGFSYIDSDYVFLGNNVKIDHFNTIRRFKHFEMQDSSFMLRFNQLSGPRKRSWPGKTVIGKDVRITSHHFIDSVGEITVGDSTTIGGRETQFWSHSLIREGSKKKISPLNISIGKQVYIGSRATLVGCSVPDFSVIGAGSVVTKQFSAENRQVLIAGNPAIVKKRYEVLEKQPVESKL